MFSSLEDMQKLKDKTMEDAFTIKQLDEKLKNT